MSLSGTANGCYSKGPLYSQKELDKVERLLAQEGFVFITDDTSLHMRIFMKDDAVLEKGAAPKTDADKETDISEVMAAIAALNGTAPPAGPVVVSASVFPDTYAKNKQADRAAAEAAAKVPPKVIKEASWAGIYLNELGCEGLNSGTMMISRVEEEKPQLAVVWEYAKRKEAKPAKTAKKKLFHVF